MPNVLILAANPYDTERLRWEEEIKQMRDALRHSELNVVAIPQADINGLHNELHSYQPRIVHFVGHGELDGLLLNDAQGNARAMPPEALADLFRLFKTNLHCVVLNACWSVAQAEAIHVHTPIVIGMSGAVEDQAALDFAADFYTALRESHGYSQAFEFGKNQMQLHGGEQHSIPVLLCRDQALTPQVYTNPYKGLAAFRQTDQQLFFGREREIAELQKLIEQQNFLALVGVSGSGKSSVVFAGLAPRLAEHWQVIECRPENNPFNRLALAFVRLLYSDKLEQASKLTLLEQQLRDGATTLAALVQIQNTVQSAPNSPSPQRGRELATKAPNKPSSTACWHSSTATHPPRC